MDLEDTTSLRKNIYLLNTKFQSKTQHIKCHSYDVCVLSKARLKLSYKYPVMGGKKNSFI